LSRPSPAPSSGAIAVVTQATVQAPPQPARSMERVARGGTANLLGAAVTAACTFALTVAITRGLSRADAGVFFSASSLFILSSTVGQLGTQTGLVYFVSRSRALGRPELIGAYVRAALRPVALTAVVMTVAMLLLARPLATLAIPKHIDDATTYLRIFALFIPVAGVEALLLASTRGLGSMRANTIIEQIGRPLGQLILVTVATTTASIAMIGWAWAAMYVPAAAAAWYSWRRLRAKYSSGRDADERVTGQFWRFTSPRAMTSVIQIVMQRFDIVLVGALAGAVDAAIYAAATRFVVAGQLGTNALTLAAQPQLAAKISTGDHDGTNELYQISTAWLVLITWPLYLTFILFAPSLLKVFGNGYSSGEVVLLLISLSMLVATGLGMVDTVLSMAGHTSWNLCNAVLALGVIVGLDVWLIPRHGIVGAAIGWAAAIFVRNVAAMTQVALALRLHPLARATAIATLLNLTCYGVVLGAFRVLGGIHLLTFVTGLALASLCYASGIVVLRGPLRIDALVAGLRRRESRPVNMRRRGGERP
jgi:O-antigen/teichoic acid export membrane protein